MSSGDATHLEVMKEDERQDERDLPPLTHAELRAFGKYKHPFRKWMPRWPEHQSLLTVLMASVTADNEIDPRETIALEALMTRSRILRKLSIEKLDVLREKVQNELGLDEWSPEPQPKQAKKIAKKRRKALKRATRSFFSSPERSGAVYLQAIDILRADQILLTSEQVFYRELAAMLGIDDHDARRYRDVILYKNAH
jgi:hypothetical protein